MPAARDAVADPRATEPRRADEVTDRLVTAIAVGEYLPGARLPAERELAATLGVGRTTVRAAIARLVDAGLLETQRGRSGGSFVVEQWRASTPAAVHRVLDARWDRLRDRCEAVAALHGVLCRLAALRCSDQDAVALGERLADYRRAEHGLPKQQADSRLHQALITTAANRTLADVLSSLEAELSIGAPAHLWGEPDGMAAMEARALEEHEALVEAVREGRADDAEAIARAHVGIDLELLEAARARAAAAS